MSDLLPALLGADGACQLLVNGAWRPARSGQTLEARSPIDDSLVGRVAAADSQDVDDVVAAAAAAWPGWRDAGFSRRADHLHAAACCMRQERERLLHLLTEEIAKTRASAEEEVDRTADLIDYFAEEGRRYYGEIIFGDSFPGYPRTKICQVYSEPLGVVLAISPFNYPLNLSASKIAPALITGNAVVFKPAAKGALAALHMCECFRRAGLPPGVLNAITGDTRIIGDALCGHPGVDMVAFTGSTAVGRQIAHVAGMKAMLSELGGKDAALVLDDADLDLAADEIVKGAFSYSGQRCTAVKRVIAVEAIADPLVAALHQRTRTLRLGDPREAATFLGPLIDDRAAAFVQELVDEALAKGAVALCGNRRNGRYLEATLLDRVTEEMRMAWEEPFGPVLPVLRVADLDAAIALANRSDYGLQSCVFTRDLDRAFAVGRRLDVGTVNVNARDSRGPDHFPFVGRKDSGMGTQGVHYSIQAMTRTKSIVLNLRLPAG